MGQRRVSKGSSRRPTTVPGVYEREYERIFSRRSGKNLTTCEFIEQVLGVRPEPYQKGIIDAVQSGFNSVIESVIPDSADDVSSGPSET